MARASKGGEIGMNGEHYAGGTFLPNTTLGKQAPKGRTVASQPRKQQVARYVWEMAPSAESRAIFSLIVGSVATEINGVLFRNEQAINYYGETIQCHSVDSLIARFNAGERWV